MPNNRKAKRGDQRGNIIPSKRRERTVYSKTEDIGRPGP